MNNNQLAKEKEAGGVTHQPLQDLNRAGQPERLNRDEATREATELQQKMEVAAKKFVELDEALWEQEPAANESYAEMCYRILGPVVHCIPGKPTTAFFRLGNQWLKLTEENVSDAFKGLFPGVDEAEGQATFLLDGIREFCKDHGKVSRVLPRLEGGLA